MSPKRFVLTAAAIFVFAMTWNGIVHGLVLHDAEAALAGLVRPPTERSLPMALLLTSGLALLFAYSHARLVRPAGIRSGLVHGAFFGTWAGLLVDLNQYLLYPIPGTLAGFWLLSGFVEFTAYGAIATWLYPVRHTPGPKQSKGEGHGTTTGVDGSNGRTSPAIRILAALASIVMLASPAQLLACREIAGYPDSLVRGHGAAAANWHIVTIERAYPVGPHRVGFVGTVKESFGGGYRPGDQARILFLADEEPHAVCPIELIPGETYLLWSEASSGPMLISRYNWLNIPSSHPRFDGYVRELRRYSPEHRARDTDGRQ